MIKLKRSSLLAVVVVSILSFPVHSQETGQAISRSVGVEISHDNVTSSGGGVYLGNGEVLSASHIFFGAKSASDPIFVVARGVKYKATPVFHGNPPENDLILLKIDAAVVPDFLNKVPAPKVCGEVEPVGAQLFVTARDVVYSTYASPYGSYINKGKTWATSTTAMLSHGVSGSPVYDSDSSCLAGIVSLVERSAIGNVADPKRAACEDAMFQFKDAGNGVTCGSENKSVFITSDVISAFLVDAIKYQSPH